MCMSGGSGYTPPPRPAATPRMADSGIQAARSDEKKRQRQMRGRSSTIKNNGMLGDLTTTSTGSLLGG